MTAADPMLVVEDAAERIGRSKATVYRWGTEGLVRIRGGKVRESELIAADKAVRDRRKVQHETRAVPVKVDGMLAGAVKYNPATGRIVGDIEPGLLLTELETRRTDESS